MKVKSFVVAPKGGIVVKRLLWWQQNGEYLKHSFNRTRFLKVLIHKLTSPFNKNLGWCTELSVIGLHTFNPGNQFILGSSDCTNLSFSKKCIILKAPWLFYSPHARESGFPNLANFHYWIRNPGLWNANNVLNPESKSHWQWVESINLEYGIHGGESRIQEGLGFLHFLLKWA